MILLGIHLITTFEAKPLEISLWKTRPATQNPDPQFCPPPPVTLGGDPLDRSDLRHH